LQKEIRGTVWQAHYSKA